tara:strand:+ start:222 stop:560 length:339 start_codon:yes stop_codon:yes gene_type:complete
MAFIQYFSEASSESLSDSYVSLLENYGMLIPQSFEHSKQLFAEFKIKNNNNFSKVNLLISWVNQSQKKCSIEIWSDEPFSKEETLCKKVHQDISQLIKPRDFSSEGESSEII